MTNMNTTHMSKVIGVTTSDDKLIGLKLFNNRSNVDAPTILQMSQEYEEQLLASVRLPKGLSWADDVDDSVDEYYKKPYQNITALTVTLQK